jgi:hypothetical protein
MARPDGVDEPLRMEEEVHALGVKFLEKGQVVLARSADRTATISISRRAIAFI